MSEDFVVPSGFEPVSALVLLKRQLRGLGPLAERGARYEFAGRAVIELAAAGGVIEARLARRPAASPEWVIEKLASSLEVRRFVDTVKKRLQQWERDE